MTYANAARAWGLVIAFQDKQAQPQQIQKVIMKPESLAVFREQVKADKKHVRMSETAKAQFRAIKEHKDVIAFHYERLKKSLADVEPTRENLAKLIQQSEQPSADTGFTLSPYPEFKIIKIPKPVAQLDHRVQKLSWWISAGYRLGEEIDSLGAVRFLSTLTEKMSDKEFANTWSDESAKKLRESRTRRGLIPEQKTARKKRAPNKSYLARLEPRTEANSTIST